MSAVRNHVALAMMTVLLATAPASGHPHIFVDAKTGFHIDERGTLTGLHISWTYDPFTTLFLFDVLDLDRDGDGVLNDEDYAAIIRGETEWADEYVGDIYLDVNAQIHPHLKPINAQADYSDDKITIRFDLPLSAPVEVPGKEVVLRVYDPNFYYSYKIIETDEAGVLPQICETELVPFEPDEVSSELLITLGSLSREETPEQENVGRLFSDEVTLSCD